jgi:hypothetical protein
LLLFAVCSTIPSIEDSQKNVDVWTTSIDYRRWVDRSVAVENAPATFQKFLGGGRDQKRRICVSLVRKAEDFESPHRITTSAASPWEAVQQSHLN